MKTQKNENMTSGSIRLTPTMWNECDKRAEELGLRSRNEFIRDAIDFYMEWLDKPSSQKFLTPALESVIGAKVRDKETYAGVELTENSRMTLGEWLDKWLSIKRPASVQAPSTATGITSKIISNRISETR